MFSLFELVAGLLTVTAAFAWVNRRILRLPSNIGLVIMGLAASLLMIGLEFLLPNTQLYVALTRAIQQIDFYEAVMHGMLAFLLFAGALHVDLGQLHNRALVVGILATLGVAISTLIIATGLWAVAALLGFPLGFAWALVFGTLIAPTDPVAVLGMLKAVRIPDTLKSDMTGEALFNDGIAVVLFVIALETAVGGDDFQLPHMAELLLIEAGGGALLGLATGFVAYRALHAIDDYSIEVLISLALVTGTYALAEEMHISGPLAVVAAGVLIGNHGAEHAMSDVTQRYVFGFWTLVDDILNAVLFLLIGVEVFILRFDPALLWIALAAPPIAVAARFCSVAAPVLALRRWHPFAKGTVPVLTWGGVRGGISIALALSLPDSESRSLILAATYAIVLFTIIVQGLTLGRVVRATAAKDAPDAPRP